jgi:hypothetical protein
MIWRDDRVADDDHLPFAASAGTSTRIQELFFVRMSCGGWVKRARLSTWKGTRPPEGRPDGKTDFTFVR